MELAQRPRPIVEPAAKPAARTLHPGAKSDAVDLSMASRRFVETIPIGFARQHGVLGLEIEGEDTGREITLAMRDPRDLTVIDIVTRLLGVRIITLPCDANDLISAINAAYQQRTGQARTLIDSLGSMSEQKTDARLDGEGSVTDLLGQIERLRGGEDLLDVSGRAPVIRLVNLLLFEAAQARASDIHVQPGENCLIVRMRVDGVLYDSFSLPRSIQEEVISRLKVMGRMNIAEKRLPQDGRATVQVGQRVIDLRLASLPTNFGERVVIRLLEKTARLLGLGELGMEPLALARFRKVIGSEHGIILVTGPTGSGKTTTLYAALQEINGKQLNILTLEDPIEYRLEGVSQTQVSDKKGMTFASGLRSVLRQDPDVIMVGEIRDRETATMAIQSALTGHLVFSTLHTNDAASAVARLLDLGIEPYLLASSVIGVLAQRLVRRICPACGERDATGARPGKGCEVCRHSGYRGRLGLFELLNVDEGVRQAVQARGAASQVKAAAIAAGMSTLRDDGIAKAGRGHTTVEEVLRVTGDE
jgi:general secretion pathway protein E